MTQISQRPVRSVRKAICEPSGDQAGATLFHGFLPSAASQIGGLVKATRFPPPASSRWMS